MSAAPAHTPPDRSHLRASTGLVERIREFFAGSIPGAGELAICLAVVLACLSAVALGAGVVVVRALWSTQF